MELGEKLRRLREAEGLRRGLWRPLTQREIVRALRQELGVSLSQAYLSQLESGARVHVSNETREALARFYHLRPADLLSDPPGRPEAAHTERPENTEDAEHAAQDALKRLTTALAQAPNPQRALRLAERLLALEPERFALVEAALDAALDAAEASADTTDKSDPSATSTDARS